MSLSIRNDISEVLQKMQVMAAHAQGISTPKSSPVASPFAQVMSQALSEVNRTQVQAESMANAFERGDTKVNIAETMIAMTKAKVEFEAAVQIRNRFINAYHEIMNMQV